MSRDPRNARFLTVASLRWIVRNRAWTPWYLVRYWRFLWFKFRNPHVITEGFVFIGKRAELYARKGYGQLILGRWVHVGEENRLRVHEGTLRVGDKTVFGRDNTINTYLDIEIGGSCIVADWVYICDFDHVFDDVNRPIKDQGIVKSPVRIGPDCWLGAKVTVTRGTFVGSGCVMAANAVVRGTVPPGAVVGGVPARVLEGPARSLRGRCGPAGGAGRHRPQDPGGGAGERSGVGQIAFETWPTDRDAARL
ncbi:MAG: acyltransferase [Candidatus Nanopelagicales bacterium]